MAKTPQSEQRLVSLRRRERAWANLVLVGLVMMILGGLIGAGFGFGTIPSRKRASPATRIGGGIAFCTVFAGVALTPIAFTSYVLRRIDRRRAIESHDWLVCRECLYPLTGCPPEGACPECGTPYTHDETTRAWKREFRVTR